MQVHYLSRAAKYLFFQETAMTALAQDVSKLTDRYQTTVPAGVRKQLKLGKGDQIRYCTEPSGRVYIEPVRTEDYDPALGAFLDFVEADIKAHPDRIRAFDGALHDRLAALVEDVDVDLDAPLSLEDE
jgi:antitoxin PrlF